ncbi:MAG: rod shape-determining protein MreD [Prevotella sp.]|jgi:rod shape-determining protein MreD|nr:rod shape-determining protein MreD [Prevotella sp.]
MTTDFFKRVWAFLLFCLVQALVLNHIHLLGYATPLLFVDFVLSFRRGTARWAILLWCFALGLCIDIFSNTPGVASGSMTLMGLLQPYLLEPFVPRDSADDLVPSMRTLGVGKFITYALIMVVIFTVTFFALEAFSFFNWQQWLITVGSSFALTFILILVIENIWNK